MIATLVYDDNTHFAKSLPIYDDTCQFVWFNISSQISQQSDNGIMAIHTNSWHLNLWCFVYQDYLVAQVRGVKWRS